MRSNVWRVFSARGNEVSSFAVVAVLSFASLPAQSQVFVQTNLVTDDQSVNAAQITDDHLVNGWGISFAPTSPFWVSSNGKGLALLYSVSPATDVTAKQGLEVTIPGNGTPTGQAFNGGTGFNADRFLFVSEDGTISGWRGSLGTLAEILQSPSPDNVYKGAALLDTGGHSYLLAANFHGGKIDVLKGDPSDPALAANFTDPGLPAGYSPFNIRVINGKIYIAYALHDQATDEDIPGAGHGIVSVFDTAGSFIGRVGTFGDLNSPWGLEIAPSSFGALAGTLLVGNFGDGRINAFNLSTNSFVGQLQRQGGGAISIDGLWGITAGNNGNGGSSDRIYFSAGPGDENHGLFGVLAFGGNGGGGAVPEPGAAAWLLCGAATVLLYRRRRQML